MANALTGNPITIDTAATIWDGTTGAKYINLIQWIDDAADIADDDDLLIVVNGVSIAAKIQLTNNTANNICVWEMNFAKPQKIDRLVVTTIDHGLLVFWLE